MGGKGQTVGRLARESMSALTGGGFAVSAAVGHFFVRPS
jgi:hypothetical protein